jgi:ABC-type Fe3+ transport system permease subunit
MDVAALGVMVPIILFICAAVVWIYVRKFENQERMSMIEKGMDPKSFRLNSTRDTSGALRASLLLIGAGIGLLMGYFLDSTFDMEEVAYFSMLFIFGGLGLGASYIIEEKKIKEESGIK